MNEDKINFVARAIQRMSVEELNALRTILSGPGGDPTGVTAVLPTGPSPREGGAEVPFEEWPDEYWESQA